MAFFGLLFLSCEASPLPSTDYLDNNFYPSPVKKSSVYGIYRYIPQVGRSKIKKDLDYPFFDAYYFSK
uniref:Uncharacterized protein n=1 Tax=Panagrolaimus sp. JU765 TaxID=591449 RepID=A0AC34QIC7_9BILA